MTRLVDILSAIALLLFVAIVGPFFADEDPAVTSARDAERTNKRTK